MLSRRPCVWNARVLGLSWPGADPWTSWGLALLRFASLWAFQALKVLAVGARTLHISISVGAFFQNRQIYPLEGCIVSTHILSCPARPSPPPLPFDQNQLPTSFKTPPSPHRLFDSQDLLDKRMHFLPQLSDFVPLRNEFHSFRAQAD